VDKKYAIKNEYCIIIIMEKLPEQNLFEGVGKFNSPQEELNFLKEQIKSKEKALETLVRKNKRIEQKQPRKLSNNTLKLILKKY
jgi:hypothetical protein